MQKYASGLKIYMNEIIDTYDSKEQFADVIRGKTISQLLKKTNQSVKNVLELYDYEAQILIDIVKQKFSSDKITTMFEQAIQIPHSDSYNTIARYKLGLKTNMNKLIDMCDSQEQFLDAIQGITISTLSRSNYLEKYNLGKRKAQAEAQAQNYLDTETELNTENDFECTVESLSGSNNTNHNLTKQVFDLTQQVFTLNTPINNDAIIQRPSKKKKTLSTKQIDQNLDQNIKKNQYNLEYYLKLYDKRAKISINKVKKKFNSDEITKMFEQAIKMPEGSSCDAMKKYASGLKNYMNEIIDTYDSKEQFVDAIKDKTIRKLLETRQISNALERYRYEAQVLINKVQEKFHSDDITTMFEQAIKMPHSNSYNTILRYTTRAKNNMNKLIDMYDIDSKEQFADAIKGKTISVISNSGYLEKYNLEKHKAQEEAQEQNYLDTESDANNNAMIDDTTFADITDTTDISDIVESVFGLNDANNNAMIENDFEHSCDNTTLAGAAIDTDESLLW
jgi:hypothetical protein